MTANKKTLSMRILESANVDYDVLELTTRVNNASEAAAVLGETPQRFYKTLVAVDPSKKNKPKLIMLAAHRNLSLKKLAASVGEKKLSMANQKQAESLTGLQVGGIGALALLNKGFEFYIDRPALEETHIVVSAGQRGLMLRVPVEALIKVSGAQVIEASDDPEA